MSLFFFFFFFISFSPLQPHNLRRDSYAFMHSDASINSDKNETYARNSMKQTKAATSIEHKWASSLEIRRITQSLHNRHTIPHYMIGYNVFMLLILTPIYYCQSLTLCSSAEMLRFLCYSKCECLAEEIVLAFKNKIFAY